MNNRTQKQQLKKFVDAWTQPMRLSGVHVSYIVADDSVGVDHVTFTDPLSQTKLKVTAYPDAEFVAFWWDSIFSMERFPVIKGFARNSNLDELLANIQQVTKEYRIRY
jgi:hypothetical protein